jgi:hypothetical protein
VFQASHGDAARIFLFVSFPSLGSLHAATLKEIPRERRTIQSAADFVGIGVNLPPA